MSYRIGLSCGILSSVLYVAMNIFAPMYFEGYSSASQTVSELSAIDAPTRSAWVPLGLVYTVLFIVFGWTVRRSAESNRFQRIVGNLILLYGLISLAWPFAPMHLRGSEFAFTDLMHIILGSATILLMIFMMSFGASAFGKAFRYYSIFSVIIFIVFGILMGIESPKIAKNLPTPWLGIWERIDIGIFLLWVIVLAIVLWQRNVAPSKLQSVY